MSRAWRFVAVAAVLVCVAGCATTPVDRAARVTDPAVISGVVIGPDGQPMEGVRVILQSPGTPVPVLSAADPMVRTDAAGHFLFDRVSRGRHQLLCLHPALGWLMAQNAQPGPPVRLVFDGRTRVIDIGR